MDYKLISGKVAVIARKKISQKSFEAMIGTKYGDLIKENSHFSYGHYTSASDFVKAWVKEVAEYLKRHPRSEAYKRIEEFLLDSDIKNYIEELLKRSWNGKK